MESEIGPRGDTLKVERVDSTEAARGRILTVCIPAHRRPVELKRCLQSLVDKGFLRQGVRVIVCDNSGGYDEVMHTVQDFMSAGVEYARNPTHISMERNLIKSAMFSNSEFTWIFGDDDYLEDAFELDALLTILEVTLSEVIVLNKTRRRPNGELVSSNWMDLPSSSLTTKSFLDFTSSWGWISILGFISTTIFRTAPFLEATNGEYLGMQYPHLCVLTQAFWRSSVLVVGNPVLCHTSPTPEQKRTAMHGEHELQFYVDVEFRDQWFFGHQMARRIAYLVDHGVPYSLFERAIEVLWSQSTVELLCKNLISSARDFEVSSSDWQMTIQSLDNLPLSTYRIQELNAGFASIDLQVSGRCV